LKDDPMSLVRIGKLIHRHSKGLGDDLVLRADQALAAQETGNYTESVAQSAQCLERLAKDALQRWNVPIPGLPALGPLVGAIDKTGKVPHAHIERLNLANRIRNSVLHDKASDCSTLSIAATEGDSLLMIHILASSVEWFLNEFQPDFTVESESDLRVFLSVGGPHRLDQTQFLGYLRAEMRNLGVRLLSLDGAEFYTGKPFDQIRELMSTCHGALVLGLERSHAYAVFVREKSEDEKYHPEQFIPTAWNQIEGAMASALELPLLILREGRLHHEGVFEAEHHSHRIRDFSLPGECRGISQDLKQFLAGWVQHLRSISSRSDMTVPSSAATCSKTSRH
jgi:hypothetical protein